MTKQEFETLIKKGHITNTYAHKYLNDEESLKNLTVMDLYNMGLVTVTGLKMNESNEVIEEETTKAPTVTEVEEEVDDTTTLAPIKPSKTEKKLEETTKAPTVTEVEEDIVVDEGEDE